MVKLEFLNGCGVHIGVDNDTEFFFLEYQETWNRHHDNSKVQIIHFPIEYVRLRSKEMGNYYLFHVFLKVQLSLGGFGNS